MKGEILNVNIQNEEKRSVRFKSMLLAVCVIAIMLVSMVVPAFAAAPTQMGLSGDWCFKTSPTKPTTWTNVKISFSYVSNSIGASSEAVGFTFGFSGSYDFLSYVQSGGYEKHAYGWDGFTGSWNGWSPADARYIRFGSEVQYVPYAFYEWFIANAVRNTNSDSPGQTHLPPVPPVDLGKEVTGVLPTVLNWIQQTLNALFVEDGALSGLLLLVAVPVAITVVFLGARFIRRCIWGA